MLLNLFLFVGCSYLYLSNMALRKMRNNIDRLFDKNLTDLIRGIRNNKENEVNQQFATCYLIKVMFRRVILLRALRKSNWSCVKIPPSLKPTQLKS